MDCSLSPVLRKIRLGSPHAPLNDCGLLNRKQTSSAYPHQKAYGVARVQEARPRVRKIGSLVNQLMSRRGYAQAIASEELQATIATSVGSELASSVHVGNLRQGVLQVFVSDSVTLQELNFQKRSILKKIQSELPHSGVIDLRFRIQT